VFPAPGGSRITEPDSPRPGGRTTPVRALEPAANYTFSRCADPRIAPAARCGELIVISHLVPVSPVMPHRCELLAAEVRAERLKYRGIEDAAIRLRDMIDEMAH
jgi:hypothetical protein